MKDVTTVSIDRETRERFARLAAKEPIARYLRKLSIDLNGKVLESPVEKRLESIESILRQRGGRQWDTSAELAAAIIEAKDLAQKLHLSEKRIKMMDMFLVRGDLLTVKGIVADLKSQLEQPGKTAEERLHEFYSEITGVPLSEIKDLMSKLAKMTPEQVFALSQYIRHNPDIKPITFKVNEDESQGEG